MTVPGRSAGGGDDPRDDAQDGVELGRVAWGVQEEVSVGEPEEGPAGEGMSFAPGRRRRSSRRPRVRRRRAGIPAPGARGRPRRRPGAPTVSPVRRRPRSRGVARSGCARAGSPARGRRRPPARRVRRSRRHRGSGRADGTGRGTGPSPAAEPGPAASTRRGPTRDRLRRSGCRATGFSVRWRPTSREGPTGARPDRAPATPGSPARWLGHRSSFVGSTNDRVTILGHHGDERDDVIPRRVMRIRR